MPQKWGQEDPRPKANGCCHCSTLATCWHRHGTDFDVMTASPIITPFLPDNLQGLHGEEERIRTESSLCINANEALNDHVELLHSCLDMLHAAQVNAPRELSDDEQVIYGLGIRLFNSGSCFLKLLLSGYYQGAVSFLRDIVEAGFLLDYFDFRPESIAAWRKGEIDEFKPYKIRQALDTRDGFEEKGRAERYGFLSTYGTHATFKGFALVATEKGLTLGPFMSEKLLAGTLTDGALHFAHPVLICLTHHKGLTLEQMKARVGFLDLINTWFGKYRDPEIAASSLKQIAELRQLFSSGMV